MTDIPKLRTGHVGGPVLGRVCPRNDDGLRNPLGASTRSSRSISFIDFAQSTPRSLAMAYTAADIERNFAAGKSRV